MRLPDFIIGGAGKCGTTSLSWYLGQHPQIFVSRLKEIHFFDNDPLYQRGLAWYAKYFAEAGDALAAGEATPNYLGGDYIAERIAADLPEVRMIFIFRDPVKRAYSNYWHAMRSATDLGSFESCVDDPRCVHFWEKSRYAKYLETYYRLMGRERIHCLLTEQLAKDPDAALAGIFRFLGVDPEARIARSTERRNTHSMPRSIAVQRWANKYIRPTTPAAETQRLDESGRLVNQKNRRRFFWARKAAMGIIATLNQKQTAYPPLDPEVSERLRPMFEQDNAHLLKLTGLPLAEFWPSARASPTEVGAPR